MKKLYHLGLDVGSTTVKLVVIDKQDNVVYSKYQRHFSDIRKTIFELVNETCERFADEVYHGDAHRFRRNIGIPMACAAFYPGVVAGTAAIENLIPQTDVVIELGGEDAKITYFEGGVEQRMNGTCAGGTGALHRPDGLLAADGCRRLE
jgi:activator of 2-hydroxyglutaryl-CoA dehydratase